MFGIALELLAAILSPIEAVGAPVLAVAVGKSEASDTVAATVEAVVVVVVFVVAVAEVQLLLLLLLVLLLVTCWGLCWVEGCERGCCGWWVGIEG